MDAQNPRLKTCPRCQDPFACCTSPASDHRCWCTKLWIPTTILEALAHEYTDCLCPSCLTQLVIQSKNAQATY